MLRFDVLELMDALLRFAHGKPQRCSALIRRALSPLLGALGVTPLVRARAPRVAARDDRYFLPCRAEEDGRSSHDITTHDRSG